MRLLKLLLEDDIIFTKKAMEKINSEFLEIIIKGARENNLKNIDIAIPRNKLVVVTGVSGSGKSSLAFDTIYAEGQRRYMQGLSSYAKQFMDVMKKPDVDTIEGLSPSISIEQRTTSRNPNSTVGTATEIYNYLRLLFARIGVQYCSNCNIPVVKKNIDQIIKEIFEKFYEKSIIILTPLVVGRKGHYKELFASLIAKGFTRVRIDGVITKLTFDMHVERYKIHDIELVIDKCDVLSENELRIKTACELAIDKGEGSVLIIEDGNEENLQYFNINYICPTCYKSYKSLSPNMFSFNTHYGACQYCNGLGEIEEFVLDLLIPNKNISMLDGAVPFLGRYNKTWLWLQLEKYAADENIDLSVPISALSEEKLQTFLYGNNAKAKDKNKLFNGFITTLDSLYNNAFSTAQKKELDEYREVKICPQCNGSRLTTESNFVKIYDTTVNDIVSLDIKLAINYFKSLEKKLNNTEREIAAMILKEIKERLVFLENVGLSYLSLNRKMGTLSGGEAQRVRLASQIGAQLVGITYVLDEPSIGLHQQDNKKLIESLKQLRDLENSVIVVEHDKAMIEEADFIVDCGPGAGNYGGDINFAVSRNKLKSLDKEKIASSLTAQYLIGEKQIEVPKEVRKPNENNMLELIGASGNNLKDVDLKIPLGLFICVTGISGSGKSSLINDTLYPILSNKIYHNSNLSVLKYKEIRGIENINKVIEVDQAPIGRTPRSNPATYTKLFSSIRNCFVQLPEAVIRGYKVGRFSFNVPGGRCEACEGSGMKKLEMNFLPDLYVPCDICNGKRYNEETLQVKYNGKSISDVLDMTVREALSFFENLPNIKEKLQVLNDVGLSYIKLGQQATTLSGGEAQRVKLAYELSKRATNKTLFLLDEPTTGLHFEDIRMLLILLQKLVDKGNTVIVIEHNLDVIKCADWIIDMGPGGGEAGGKIIAEGAPYDIVKNKKSITGKYLKNELI